MTIIGITSNLSSISKEPSNYPKVFLTNLSNWRSCNLLFHKVGFPMHSQIFLGISITSLPVSICISKSKLLILMFSIMSFFFSSIFSSFFCFLFFTERLAYWFCFLQLFQRFSFWICILLENGSFLKQCVQVFLNAGYFSLFISCSRPQYDHFYLFFLHVSIGEYLFARLTFIMVVFLY